MSKNIPGPPSYPFIGGALEIRKAANPIEAFSRLADTYGPICRLTLAGRQTVLLSSVELVNEVCDETRFWKTPPLALSQGGGQAAGLFTSETDSHDWELAHRVLNPAFGPLSIQQMFDPMHDIVKQLALSWARKGPEHRIDMSGDFTRLTLDTIALCSMNFRFNSFYQEGQHPFVAAMNLTLGRAATRARGLPSISSLLGWKDLEFEEALQIQVQIAKAIVDDRRQNPSERKDLLNAMIKGRDPKTGEQMSDELITANMITFLIAGHETTSSLLSFACLLLLNHPEAYRTAQSEVDRVLGPAAATLAHMKELKYLNAVLRETIRLYPTAPIFNLKSRSKESHFRLGEYLVPSDTVLRINVSSVHRDPSVYGQDANEFKPERMLDGKFKALPKNAWKPFGNGMRACIGRTFAWQEALLAMAVLLQRFDFTFDDPSYELKVKFQLTIKPQDFFVRARLRHGLDATEMEHALNASLSNTGPRFSNRATGDSQETQGTAGKEQLSVFYGSNTGTCETLAQRLVANAGVHGFSAKALPLDEAVEAISTEHPTVIMTASYEGQPPDNAAHFVDWLSGTSGEKLKGARFAVYGCGHHDWHDTLHRIPKLVDDTMAARGATRLTAIGVCDVADDDPIDRFETWLDESLWPALPSKGVDAKDSKTKSAISIEISSTKRTTGLHQSVEQATILDIERLTAAGEPEKRHLEVQLPEGMEYTCGDYLAVLPLNNTETVRRVFHRFGLPFETAVKLSADSATTLPKGQWISVADILRGYVELTQPASKKDIRNLTGLASSQKERAALEALVAEVDAARSGSSALDLLERFPSVDLPFATFLGMLPPIRARLYSISSSPRHSPHTATITYSVLSGGAAELSAPGSPTIARRSTNHFTPGSSAPTIRPPGVASTHLSALRKGDQVAVAVRPCRSAFRLPAHPAAQPLILVAAGTGLAPFRGFVQERAALRADGRPLAPALLFVGCRARGRDTLYEDELQAWERAGAVSVRYAFSRGAAGGVESGRVQHRMKRDHEEIRTLWEQGGKVFLCGAGASVKDVGDVLKETLFGGDGERWRDAMREGRVVMDVFG